MGTTCKKKKNYTNNNNLNLIKIKLIIFEIVHLHLTNLILILKGKWSLRKLIFHKFIDFNFSEINTFFEDLKKILKIKKKLNFKKISKELYLISSK